MSPHDEARALSAAYGWLYDAEERAAARRSRKARRAARKYGAELAIALPPHEIAAYTDRERPSAQARVLARMGIPHKRRPDGSLLVLRCHVEGPRPGRAIVPAEPKLVL